MAGLKICWMFSDASARGLLREGRIENTTDGSRNTISEDVLSDGLSGFLAYFRDQRDGPARLFERLLDLAPRIRRGVGRFGIRRRVGLRYSPIVVRSMRKRARGD